MSDTFHDIVATQWIDEMMCVIDDCPQHTFQILTKRSDNIIEKLDCWNGKLPHNVWLGVTVESDKYLSRIEDLLKVQAAVRFVSIEPCLGPVDIKPWLGKWTGKGNNLPQPLSGALEALPDINGLDQVIVGGESGPGARPMHPSWARNLRDQCQDASTPYFFKQWGEWAPFGGGSDYGKIVMLDGTTHDFISFDRDHPRALQGGVVMHKLGKKRAGRLLDGREWNGMPK